MAKLGGKVAVLTGVARSLAPLQLNALRTTAAKQRLYGKVDLSRGPLEGMRRAAARRMYTDFVQHRFFGFESKDRSVCEHVILKISVEASQSARHNETGALS